ncbi:MBL fold metallo-hydrolase [Radiobacillus kanasensis]|uniref:MBL fold metallo-hydrolase n=1 Tax=Radiobacillus kanasensis TaxID=2844358 RepID=UPI001E57596C|nr:MBL fold metallo-hydrolase [Radiobacillus kanasensis]UFU00511.1 MBL fold metallo-hydrolase [Radiobacillus kanasensis]
MKLTVIGFWGAYPEAGGATSSYLLEKEGFSLLIDCGSGALSRLQAFKPVKDLDAVLLSHYHQDHIADIGVLQYAWLVQNAIHGTKDVLPIYGHQDDPEGFDKLNHDYTKAIAYNPKKALEVGPFTITFIPTKHPVPCYAMRITDGEKVIVYTADSSYKQEFIDFVQSADLLITDCNFYEDQDGSKAGHMTSKEGAEIANQASVNALLLSHLPHHGTHDQLSSEARKYFSGSIELAYEGYTFKT